MEHATGPPAGGRLPAVHGAAPRGRGLGLLDRNPRHLTPALNNKGQCFFYKLYVINDGMSESIFPRPPDGSMQMNTRSIACWRWLKQIMQVQWIRFLIVGSANTALSYAIYAGLYAAGLNYCLASLGSIIVGIGISYLSQGILVFGNMSIAAFGRFILIWGLIYAAHIAMVAVCIEIGIGAYWGGVVAFPISAVLSYLLQKFAVFKNHPSITTPRLD